MMSNMPMGYYSSNSLAAEARRRGVQILPVDINASGDKCHAERTGAIRLGLRLVAEFVRATSVPLSRSGEGMAPSAHCLNFAPVFPCT